MKPLQRLRHFFNHLEPIQPPSWRQRLSYPRRVSHNSQVKSRFPHLSFSRQPQPFLAYLEASGLFAVLPQRSKIAEPFGPLERRELEFLGPVTVRLRRSFSPVPRFPQSS